MELLIQTSIKHRPLQLQGCKMAFFHSTSSLRVDKDHCKHHHWYCSYYYWEEIISGIGLDEVPSTTLSSTNQMSSYYSYYCSLVHWQRDDGVPLTPEHKQKAEVNSLDGNDWVEILQQTILKSESLTSVNFWCEREIKHSGHNKGEGENP